MLRLVWAQGGRMLVPGSGHTDATAYKGSAGQQLRELSCMHGCLQVQTGIPMQPREPACRDCSSAAGRTSGTLMAGACQSGYAALLSRDTVGHGGRSASALACCCGAAGLLA